MFAEALASRLRVIEEEILRLTKLGGEASDTAQQDNYFGLAQDLQREALRIRSEIKRLSLDPVAG
jgi:hypothetical protein